MFTHANALVVQVLNVYDCPESQKRFLESLVPRSPVDYRARHRSTLAAVSAIDKKPEPGIV
jgi:hypothetical protein